TRPGAACAYGCAKCGPLSWAAPNRPARSPSGRGARRAKRSPSCRCGGAANRRPERSWWVRSGRLASGCGGARSHWRWAPRVSRLDYVVQAALELAYVAAQHDDNVGVMAFADGVQHFVAPQRGRLGLKRVLDVLAVVEATLIEPDYPGAFRYLAARNRKRALTVLFTDVIDRFASDALVANVASLRPRHLPLAVTLRNPEVDAVAVLRPNTTRDAFRKAAAEELLRARE